MKTTARFSFIALGATLVAVWLLPVRVAAQTNATVASTSTEATGAKPIASMKVPSKLDEIAQLTKAGVGDTVILAYIKDSPTAYSLDAQDIIKLRDQGVSPEITTALIQHGAEVRQAAQEAAKESQPQTAEVAAAPTYQAQQVMEQPAPANVVYVAAPVRPASTVSVHYFGAPSYHYTPTYYAPRYVSSPGYVSFGSSYRYAPRASFSIGFGSHYRGHYSSARYCR